MDLFSNLDNFLSEEASAPLPESPSITFNESLNDSQEDYGASVVVAVQKDAKKRFSPAKGQKGAVKRLKKIQDEMTRVIKEKASPKKATKRKHDGIGLNEETARQIADILAEQMMAENSAAAAIPSRPRNRRRRMPNFVVNDDVVDLVSSPFLIVPGTVTLDSDEELEEIRSKTNAGVDSPQFDTNEVNVKVACGSTIEEFPFRRHQKMADLRKLIADKISADENSLLLLFKEKVVDCEDTPHKLGYLPGMMFSARSMDTAPVAAKKRRNDAEIVLKVQSSAWRKVREMRIGKKEPINVLIYMCAEELKCDANSIKLTFDGETLEPHQTADDYDMEGGEIVDIHLK